MQLLTLLLISCNPFDKYRMSKPDYYVMEENINGHYKFYFEEELIDKIIPMKIDLCLAVVQEEEDKFFDQITKEELQDKIFTSMLKMIFTDVYSFFLYNDFYKELKLNLITKEEYDGNSGTLRKDGSFKRLGLDNIFYDMYKVHFNNIHPGNVEKIEKYVNKIRYLFPKSRDIALWKICPFGEYMKVMNRLHPMMIYQKEYTVEALYNKYIARIDNIDLEKRKQELYSAIKDYGYKIVKSKLLVDLKIEARLAHMTIKDGKVAFAKANGWIFSRGSNRTIDNFLICIGLSTRYKDNILYIENIPVKLVKYILI